MIDLDQKYKIYDEKTPLNAPLSAKYKRWIEFCLFCVNICTKLVIEFSDDGFVKSKWSYQYSMAKHVRFRWISLSFINIIKLNVVFSFFCVSL